MPEKSQRSWMLHLAKYGEIRGRSPFHGLLDNDVGSRHITFGQPTKLAAALCIGRWWLTMVLVTPRLRAHEGDNDLL